MTGPGEDAPLPVRWRDKSLREWTNQLGVPHLELHGTLPSTNERLRRLAGDGAQGFTTVVADEQSDGRGREGRSWHSPADVGLWISVLVPLDRPGNPGVLPLAVGVAVARAIESVSGVTVSLKWPNDALVEDRKVAGVLCETVGDSGDLAAVGIGVNLRPPPTGLPRELRESAGFLDEFTAGPVREPQLASALLSELRRWACPTPVTLSGALRAEWGRRDGLRGRAVELVSGERGVARAVSLEGSLEIELQDGSAVSVRAGSVRLLGSAHGASDQVREG